MQQNTQALDRSLILDTLSSYAWGYDEGNFDMLADTFTADGSTGGKVAGTDIGWGPMVGREEIVAILSSIRASQTEQRRHTVHTPRFEVLTDNTATVACYTVIFGSSSGTTRIVTSGWYRADLVKESDGVWRMRHLDALLDSPF
jgi:hypothetical protein